jgi:hypothetical protein
VSAIDKIFCADSIVKKLNGAKLQILKGIIDLEAAI